MTTEDPHVELCPECGSPLPSDVPRCPSCGAAVPRKRPHTPVATPLTEAEWSRVERSTAVFLAVSMVLGAVQLWMNPAARRLQVLGSVVVLGAGLGVLRAFRARSDRVLNAWALLVTAAAVFMVLSHAVWTAALAAPLLQRVAGWSAVLNAVVHATALRRARRSLDALTAPRDAP